MTCELNYAGTDPTIGARAPGKDIMHQILLRRNILTLTTVRETKSTQTPDIIIRLGLEAQPITNNIDLRKRTTTTGTPRISIGNEEISKKNSGLGGIPGSMMGRETATSGGPTTTTTRSIASTSRSSIGNRRNSSGARSRRMITEGSSTRKEMKRLRMPLDVPVSAFLDSLVSPSSCLESSLKTINMLQTLQRTREAPCFPSAEIASCSSSREAP